MSFSKLGRRTRSLQQHPWIINCICSSTRKQKAQTIDVLGHVDMLSDEGLETEVADGEVTIRAVFSAQAVQKFREEQEELDKSPVNWDHALLLLLKYHKEFRPHRKLDLCEFVLHIDHFRLWDLQEEFVRKTDLIQSKTDARLQSKIKDLWELKRQEWREQDMQKRETGDSCSQQNGSVSITQLLDEVQQQRSPAPMSPMEIIVEESRAGTRVDGNIRRPFSIAELLVPEHQQIRLQDIPEWKEGYLPLSLPSQDGSSSKTDSYVKPTLMDDVSNLATSRKAEKGDLTLRKSPGEERDGRRLGKKDLPTSPENMSSATPDGSQVTENPSEYQNPTVPGEVGDYLEMRQASLALNSSGSFAVCDVGESQGFVPCLSPVDNNNGRNVSQDRSVTCGKYGGERHDFSEVSQALVHLEAEEDRRLEKMATPSKHFSGGELPMPNLGQKVTAVTDKEVFAETELIDKRKTAETKQYRQETPMSSSQSDSENENQVKRRRLTFWGTTEHLQNEKGLTKREGENRKYPTHDEPMSDVQDCVKGGNSACPVELDDESDIGMGTKQEKPRMDRRLFNDEGPVLDTVEQEGKQPRVMAGQHNSLPAALGRPDDEAIMISSEEFLSSGENPSVLKSTCKKTMPDREVCMSTPPYSLPSYQCPRPTPPTPRTITHKAQLLTSLTDLAAPTEIGGKLLKLKYPGSLLTEMVHFYTNHR